MAGFTRRKALITGAVAAAGTAAEPGVRTADAADRAGSKYNWGHTMAFGEQYFTHVLEILGNIRRNEMTLIGDIAGRMTDSLKKGGNVWMQAQAGHMGYIEFDEKHNGNPKILKSCLVWNGGDYDKMKPGDVLMTNYVNEDVKAARDKGVYVVGVPVCYVDNEWAPRGFVSPNPNNWLLGDVSSVILQSYVPYHQGIVDCPQIPEMKICPSAANPLNSLFWMFQCEVASRVKNAKAKPVEAAARMLDTIMDRIRDAYRTQKDLMFDHAATVAKMIGGGGNFHVTSDHEGVQAESNGVAMGPMMTNAFRDKMKKGDVHLVATIEPIPSGSSMRRKRRRRRACSSSPSRRVIRSGYAGTAMCSSTTSARRAAVSWTSRFPGEGRDRGRCPEQYAHVDIHRAVRGRDGLPGWVPWFWMGGYTVPGPSTTRRCGRFSWKQGF